MLCPRVEIPVGMRYGSVGMSTRLLTFLYSKVICSFALLDCRVSQPRLVIMVLHSDHNDRTTPTLIVIIRFSAKG